METEVTEAVRQAGNLQNNVNQNRFLLEQRPKNSAAIYKVTADLLSEEFDQDYSKIIHYIKVKLDWPLSFKRTLLHYVQIDESINKDKFNNIANFVFDPTAKIKKPRQFRAFIPTIASIERQYGSGVCSIFYLQYGFFIINLLTLIVWISLIIVPYKVLVPSLNFSNSSFSFSTIFTTEGYLSESILFQGSYPYGTIDNKYNLSLIYLLTTYLYFIIWFIFLTIHFSSAYKKKVLNSILGTKLRTGFEWAFSRHDYTCKEIDKRKQIFQRQFLDLIENDERTKKLNLKKYKTFGYKFKLIITNLFYVILSLALGGLNWLILSYCGEPDIDCHGSIIYLVIINRLMPYIIVILTQIEHYKDLSYKLDVVGFRCIFLNMCTILSFTIYFFINAVSCYETAFGQYIYMLLLSDIFASLIFPFLFGFIFDLISTKDNRDFDGINIHVQLSPPVLLYSQFLIWIGIYFSPLLSIMILVNILISFLSHRLYLYFRSRRSSSNKRVFTWNSSRLEYLIYLLAYIVLIISVTCFIVFTTQIKPSETCGPFRQLNASYEIVENYIRDYQKSVLWVSIVNFLTSPGLIYFLGVTFFVIAYKLRHEGLAEKQLVFIRENNLESKKNLRQNAVKKLHEQQKNTIQQRNNLKTTSIDIDNDIS